MRIWRKLFGGRDQDERPEKPTCITIKEFGISFELPSGNWKVSGGGFDGLKERGLVGWLYPSHDQDSVRITITREPTSTSIEEYARAAAADLRRQELYAGAEFTETKVGRRGVRDWGEFHISLPDGTITSFHVTKSPDDRVCYTIVCTGTSKTLYKTYENDMSAVLDSLRFAGEGAPGSQEDVEKPTNAEEVRLWLRDPNVANDPKLLCALLIKEDAPDWVGEKALMGDYRVEADQQQGGCVLIFTRE